MDKGFFSMKTFISGVIILAVFLIGAMATFQAMANDYYHPEDTNHYNQEYWN